MMDTLCISDLEVAYRVGVTEAERAVPQRLALTVEMQLDTRRASASDDLAGTIDYFAVCQQLLQFGESVHWALIETVAADIANMILDEYRPDTVTVEVKKFAIPEARYVAVRITRRRAGSASA